MLRYDQILRDLESYIGGHTSIAQDAKKYKEFKRNRVGQYYRDRIIKNLRLQDEVQQWLTDSGQVKCPCMVDGRTEYRLTNLTIDDILVETTLPKTALNTLKTFSVGVLPDADVSSEKDKAWCREFERAERIHEKEQDIVIDMLATGNAFVKVEKGPTGRAKVIVLPPENVVIIPDEFNESEPGAYVYHAIQYDYKGNKSDYVEIYTMDGKVCKINNLADLSGWEEVTAGLGEITMHHFKGLDSSDRYPLYGLSLFDGLDTTMIEEVERLTSNSYLFNKVNNPNMVSSADFAEIDPNTGERIVHSGKFYKAPNPEDAAATRYIEPPTGHVAAMTEHINHNLRNAYAQLGVNEISLGLVEVGGVASGEAYKKAITPTLNKCRDITNRIYIPLLNIYRQAHRIETGQDLSIDLKFSDGISLSDSEIIANQASLINNGILSRRTVLIQRGYTEAEAKKELQMIAEDNAMIEPVVDTVNLEDIGADEPAADTPEDNLPEKGAAADKAQK